MRSFFGNTRHFDSGHFDNIDVAGSKGLECRKVDNVVWNSSSLLITVYSCWLQADCGILFVWPSDSFTDHVLAQLGFFKYWKENDACKTDLSGLKTLSRVITTVTELAETARSISTSCRRSSMREWRHCVFLLSMGCSPSLSGTMQITLESRLKAFSRVNTTVIELYCPLECVVAGSPTLEESYLSKDEGRRPKNRPFEEGDGADPGLASRRDCVL